MSDSRLLGAAPTPPVVSGQVIAGKYVVGECLAFGGMGVVYEAVHKELGQRCVLKFVRTELAGDRSIVERFQTEARVAASLRGDHIARVVDCGTLDSGVPYLVMEHLEGDDLFSLLKRSGTPPIVRAVDLVLEACEGLAEAHTRGLVHRDIKPENLFLAVRPDGGRSIKLLDFGISKQVGSPESRALTGPDASLGSPDYMAPEQMRDSRAVDPRADIWSLGVVLFELFTGRLPFGGETVPEVCAKVLTERPPSPSSLCPGLPAGLDAIVLRCLAKRPQGRFDDVAELARALAPFASLEGRMTVRRVAAIFERERPPTPVRRGSLPALVRTPAATESPGGHIPGVRPRAPLIAGVAVVLGALLLTAWSVERTHSASTQPVRELVGAARSEAPAVDQPALEPRTETEDAAAPTQPLLRDRAERKRPAPAPTAALASPRPRPPTKRFAPLRAPAASDHRGRIDDLKLDLEVPRATRSQTNSSHASVPSSL